MKRVLLFLVLTLVSHRVSARSLYKRAAFYIANETACVVDNIVYYNGDPIPTDDPCEACKCRPPGFACVLRECEVKPGCRAVRRTGHCCPEYVCGCEHNGRMYRDGDEIRDSQNPCYTCHCQGSAIACAFVDCFFRVDCAPDYVKGECCPRYDHCPPLGPNSNDSFSVPSSENPTFVPTAEHQTTSVNSEIEIATIKPAEEEINTEKEFEKVTTVLSIIEVTSKNPLEPPEEDFNKEIVANDISKLDPSSLFYIPKENSEPPSPPITTLESITVTTEAPPESSPKEEEKVFEIKTTTEFPLIEPKIKKESYKLPLEVEFYGSPETDNVNADLKVSSEETPEDQPKTGNVNPEIQVSSEETVKDQPETDNLKADIKVSSEETPKDQPETTQEPMTTLSFVKETTLNSDQVTKVEISETEENEPKSTIIDVKSEPTITTTTIMPLPVLYSNENTQDNVPSIIIESKNISTEKTISTSENSKSEIQTTEPSATSVTEDDAMPLLNSAELSDKNGEQVDSIKSEVITKVSTVDTTPSSDSTKLDTVKFTETLSIVAATEKISTILDNVSTENIGTTIKPEVSSEQVFTDEQSSTYYTSTSLEIETTKLVPQITDN